ncbi:MAG TPA: SDR family NAD(P)-dependent oxidoreductase [Actinoplanes sp.]|jgi:3-oxoacyl-[acyl-carrier protein] reductase|nr:SDR family NAD(P)-dependent oxidoreductase [Actinoplanes sp.]
MGRLIRVGDVERIAASGGDSLAVAPGEILSPLARDRARDLGIELRARPVDGGPAARTEELVRQALGEVLARVGDGDLEEVIRQVVAEVGARRSDRWAPPGAASDVGPILAGRVALVTGASSGIGAAVAVALAAAGARVAVGTFAGDPHPAAAVAERIRRDGGECVVVQADVTSTEQVDAACERAAASWGRLDIAVANAGVLRRDPIGSLSDQRWRDLLDVDLGGVMRTARAASARMAAGGALVCVSSIAGGVFGWAEHAHYAAAKAGMLGLTRSLAVELGPRAIRVNAVLPGLIETPQSLDEGASVGAAGLRAAAGAVPLRRIGAAAEVADAIRFLVSDQASYITGQSLVVDGGISIALPL